MFLLFCDQIPILWDYQLPKSHKRVDFIRYLFLNKLFIFHPCKIFIFKKLCEIKISQGYKNKTLIKHGEI